MQRPHALLGTHAGPTVGWSEAAGKASWSPEAGATQCIGEPCLPCDAITDVDADGVELHAFDLTPNVLPQTVLGLVRDRVVADVERIEPDFPEHHVALVQPLRSARTATN